MPAMQALSRKEVVKRSDEHRIHFNIEWAQHRYGENVYLIKFVAGGL